MASRTFVIGPQWDWLQLPAPHPRQPGQGSFWLLRAAASTAVTEFRAYLRGVLGHGHLVQKQNSPGRPRTSRACHPPPAPAQPPHGPTAACWRQREEEPVLAQMGLGRDLDCADEATHPALQLQGPGSAPGVGCASHGQVGDQARRQPTQRPHEAAHLGLAEVSTDNLGMSSGGTGGPHSPLSRTHCTWSSQSGTALGVRPQCSWSPGVQE